MVIAITGNLTLASEIVQLHFRLLGARREILGEPPERCTVDLREVDAIGVNAAEMVSCFMRWFRDHHPCGTIELLL